jgi:ubiquinone/menaquinone biosynthesis C-methylase UbiE
MSTFGQRDFDSINYDFKRPVYPESLFIALFEYHQGTTNRALDIGCGPGTASFSLLEYVDTVIATDPSAVMLELGINHITPELKDRIEFKVASEDLSQVVPDNSTIDLIISAEAMHYVKHDAFFKEAARVMRPGATLAYWAYIEVHFMHNQEANEIYSKYIYDEDKYLGPCWSPGKSFHRYFYNDIKIPEDDFRDIEKYDYYPEKTKTHTAYFQGDSKYSLKKLRENASTWSGTHKWRTIHRGSKDIIDLMIEELKEKCGWTDESEFKVEWGTTYIFARRR